MRPAADPPPRRTTLDGDAVRAEIGQVRLDFRRLVTRASATDLRQQSARTKWTNQ